MRDIIVNLTPGRPQDPASAFAISLAAAFGSHLTATAFALEPAIPASAMGGFGGDVIDNAIADSQRHANDALAAFEAAAKAQGVAYAQQTHTALLADAASRFGQIARHFDASVVLQPEADADSANELFVESALFGSGRPVIVVPYVQKDPFKLDRVVCCWDGSATASRAIGDAAPLLARANHVELLIVTEDDGSGLEESGAAMTTHLGRLGLKATLERITATDIDVGDAILSHAADNAADFLVMGGYGHSRWREFLLGGVTREILATMTLPVLMSH